jgi:RNA polymerase sigma-70 factor (ECF subfamily)
MCSSRGDVTQLLAGLKLGDQSAKAKLIPLVYSELRRLAASYMRRERADHTLQATALVHEAFLRLAGQESMAFESRTHFFGVAAQVMRHILVDHARANLRSKRGGKRHKVCLDDRMLLAEDHSAELLAVDQALDRLDKLNARQGRIVEFRFFGGLSVEETAEVMGVSPKTVKREWSLAKAWLYQELHNASAHDAR